MVLRGLDALTTNEKIIECINRQTNSIIKIKNCQIARDPLTNLSNGYAFVELNSIQVLKNKNFFLIFFSKN